MTLTKKTKAPVSRGPLWGSSRSRLSLKESVTGLATTVKNERLKKTKAPVSRGLLSRPSLDKSVTEAPLGVKRTKPVCGGGTRTRITRVTVEGFTFKLPRKPAPFIRATPSNGSL